MMRNSLYSLAGFKAAFAFAQIFPRGFCQWLGARVAVASYQRLPQVQAILQSNLGRVTARESTDLQILCTENVANFGRMLADYFRCAGLDAARQAEALVAEWRGREHLEAARARGRGVIVVTAHLGHWELGGILLARLGWPMNVVTLDEPSTDLTRWRDACRRHLGIRTVMVGPGHPFSFVELIQTLRRNELMAMLVDRPFPGSGAPVQFFGRETEFSTGPALLAHHTGAAVLPAFVLQGADGRYISFADPIIPMAESRDPRAVIGENTQRIATSFEAIVRAHPEQWFNYAPVWRA